MGSFGMPLIEGQLDPSLISHIQRKKRHGYERRRR